MNFPPMSKTTRFVTGAVFTAVLLFGQGAGALPSHAQSVTAACHVFGSNLSVGMRGASVTALQQALLNNGLSIPAGATGYFGAQTRAAVVAYQEKYASEILSPGGFSRGTGFVGPATRAKLNTCSSSITVTTGGVCKAGDLFNIMTGARCGTVCKVGDLYNTMTGARCSTSSGGRSGGGGTPPTSPSPNPPVNPPANTINLIAGDITPTSVTAGTESTFYSRISNTGSVNSSVGFANTLQRSVDGATNIQSIATWQRTIPLYASMVALAQFNYTFPSAGTWYVRACADKNLSGVGTITESSETDNCGAWVAVMVAPSGAVLGNSTSQLGFQYVWNNNLQIGSPNVADVSALQTALMNEGVYSGEITGGFYSQTFAAVQQFQQKYGIDSTGFVGPITRTKLNSLYQ